ncbi:hypothetical protein B0E43_15410 [Algoriphagus sp. A40]|nr:hypothetical protein B0E43_15410 [Algoriphagus sp. A40]
MRRCNLNQLAGSFLTTNGTEKKGNQELKLVLTSILFLFPVVFQGRKEKLKLLRVRSEKNLGALY